MSDAFRTSLDKVIRKLYEKTEKNTHELRLELWFDEIRVADGYVKCAYKDHQRDEVFQRIVDFAKKKGPFIYLKIENCWTDELMLLKFYFNPFFSYLVLVTFEDEILTNIVHNAIHFKKIDSTDDVNEVLGFLRLDEELSILIKNERDDRNSAKCYLLRGRQKLNLPPFASFDIFSKLIVKIQNYKLLLYGEPLEITDHGRCYDEIDLCEISPHLKLWCLLPYGFVEDSCWFEFCRVGLYDPRLFLVVGAFLIELKK